MEKEILFWSAMVYTILLCATMIGFGWLFLHRPPKDINSLYGYRTSMSMKNRQTWIFAHQYAGKVWFFSGVISLIVSVPLLLATRKADCFEALMTALLFVLAVPVIGVILPTERALRKRFDRFGNPKE